MKLPQLAQRPQTQNTPTPQPQSQVNATLAKILGATASGQRHPYIKDGDYLFEVLNCEEKNFKGNSVVIELKVLECEAKADSAITPNPVGATVSYHNNMSKTASAAGNIKAFFLALAGAQDGDPSFPDMVKACLGQEQLAKGMKIYGSTFRNVTQSGPNVGKEYVGVNWITYTPDDTQPLDTQSPANNPPKNLKI